MAFNRQGFIAQKNLSPADKIINQSRISTQRPSISGVVNQTATDLLQAGTSILGIQSGIAAQTSGLQSDSQELYFALVGLDVSRTNGKTLSELRRVQNQSADAYFRESNPSTRIARKRKERNLEILSAI